MIKLIVSLCLLILISINSLAQEKYTISGYIKDAGTGEVLIGSSIYIQALEKGVATLQYSHVGQLCVEAFEQTGREFKINLPITGDYMIGANWKDCH